MSAIGKLRVLIVDNTTLVRQGIKSLLEKREAIELIREATDAQEATELAQGFSPDVILMDQDMPGLGCIDAIRIIKERRPQTEVIVLAESPDDDKAFRTFEAGASAYILKDIDADDLCRAIEGVCNGKTLVSPQIARQLVDRFRILTREHSARNGTHVSDLTNRELQIVLEMTKGATDREIAHKLYLRATTVKTHVRSIFRKLGARNRTQAVAYMLATGTGSDESPPG